MRLLLPFIVFLVLVPNVTSSFGIPGTTQTISGYDTEVGEDPICWRCSASAVEGDIPFPNPLIKDFKLTGEVALLRECPALNYITAEAPPEFQRGERLRTGQLYDYKVSITLNLDSLGGNAFISDEGPLVAVQIIVCKLGAGFCSPYIHEEANARLEAQGIYESPEEGDSHGGTHTHSGYEIFQVPPENGPIYNISMTVPMLVNTAGDYFAIAAVQMYIGSELGESAEMRYDMANALLQDQRLITYQEPAEILVVPDGVMIASYVAIGLVALVILFLLVETIKNRNHQILRLTQGYFLIVFLIAALILSVSSFLFEPKNDFYCNASFPIILTSAQLLYAITLGRLWRINAVISPLLMKTLRQKTSWSSVMMESMRAGTSLDVTGRRSMFRKSMKLRKQISPLKLGLVVSLFTLPQVIIQVLSLVLQPQSLMIQFNDDRSQGRVMCDSGVDMKANLRDYGFWVFLLLVVLLLFMAQATSQLPSLFNESKVIYESALFTIVLLLLGVGVIVVTDDPNTSPAVGYLVCVVWTLSIALSTSLRIMLPKLRMVWRNEKVVISTLVSDHAKSVRREDERYINSRSSRASCVVSGLTQQERMPSRYNISTGNSTVHSTSQEVADEMTSDTDVDYEHSNTTTPDDHDDEAAENKKPTSTGDTENMESSPDSSAEFPRPQAPPQSPGRPKPRNEESFKRRLHALPSQRRFLSNKILVKCDEPPARRLVLKMVDLQEQLAAVNERIMSGLVVSEDEWTTLRQLANRLGSAFNDDVDFAWENEMRANSARSWKNEYKSKDLTVEEETEEEVERDTVVRFQGDEDSGNESADESSSDASDVV
jgi:cadmium resistance protein CadD (predicted permease)